MMKNVQINLTGCKAKWIVLVYTIGFIILSYLERTLYLKYLIVISSYTFLYLGVFTLIALKAEKIIISLKKRKLLDVAMIATYFYFLGAYIDLAQYTIFIL